MGLRLSPRRPRRDSDPESPRVPPVPVIHISAYLSAPSNSTFVVSIEFGHPCFLCSLGTLTNYYRQDEASVAASPGRWSFTVDGRRGEVTCTRWPTQRCISWKEPTVCVWWASPPRPLRVFFRVYENPNHHWSPIIVDLPSPIHVLENLG